QVEDGPHNESDEKDKSEDDSSPKEVNVVGQHIALKTCSNWELIIHLRQLEFFSDKDEPEVDLGNITNSYIVPTTPNTRIHKDHPIKNVIGDVKSSIQTRRMTKSTSEQGFLSAKQSRKNFCNSSSKKFRNLWICLMGRGPLEQNRQEEGIDYKEVFALVERIEAIRLFLAYASLMGFLVYQIDVKSAFLYGTIKEEVYVTQPLGFKDSDHPDKVY
ncbi:putative ribonuclease H-like domain-containing protein, partial [Tanacetum coccineum]